MLLFDALSNRSTDPGSIIAQVDHFSFNRKIFVQYFFEELKQVLTLFLHGFETVIIICKFVGCVGKKVFNISFVEVSEGNFSVSDFGRWTEDDGDSVVIGYIRL